ncbi:carboxypeptidase-like regulatory domain-containing protein [Cobetia sp. 5-25-4-2]|uniref:carboxypeptidase-like regulatory domain-containing protein n=1 Tax=Cobetia sp. 5-25-4-2 TaxID=2737459 RepID=UPI0015971206|nr:carboxypeptidase-like regulatory domain-containing protein [Cobetia sp. 5-25-4-2]
MADEIIVVNKSGVNGLYNANQNSVRVVNPSAIKNNGQSSILVVTDTGLPLVRFDQLDGSGANGTATGGVSDPARMGVIAGTVLDIQAQPVSRRVRVHERATGRIVRETWSDADGKYRFTDLDPRIAFYVMAFDHTLQQNAVVSDNVHSEVEDAP